MAYRRYEPPKHRANRTMQDTASHSTLFLTNGTTSDFSIPCWYWEIRGPIPAPPHSRPEHDHRGWPSPGHPDGSCQEWDFARHSCGKGHRIPVPRSGHGDAGPGYHGGCGRHGVCRDYLDMSRLSPIHLTAEGYDKVTVSFDEDKPSGLTAAARIDATRDWIVRILFTADEKTAVDSPVRCRYVVKASRGTGAEMRKDIVSIGEVVILPAPLTT